jgi:hypothetical protein
MAEERDDLGPEAKARVEIDKQLVAVAGSSSATAR